MGGLLTRLKDMFLKKVD